MAANDLMLRCAKRTIALLGRPGCRLLLLLFGVLPRVGFCQQNFEISPKSALQTHLCNENRASLCSISHREKPVFITCLPNFKMNIMCRYI